MHHNCGAVPQRIHAPDPLKQRLLGEHNVGIGRQKQQQLKLPVCQGDLLIL